MTTRDFSPSDRTLPAPYYQDDAVTIYHGDCREIVPSLPPVDLVVTSPPYNLANSPWGFLGHWKPGDSVGGKGKWRDGADSSRGAGYLAHGDDLPWPDYVAWQREILRLCWSQLSDVGAIFYNHKPRVIGERLWTPLELVADYPVRQIVIWDRGSGMNFAPTAYLPMHEWIVILAKPAFRLRDRGASGVGDVWHITPEVSTPHPAPFPVQLAARAIETTRAESILDPFLGSGSSLRAAKNLGRKAIGIEIEERYCEIAANRMRQTVMAL